jgi:hypothetical protein
LAKEGRFWARGAPESQTLIVRSLDPDTILVPSEENATDQITLLCAFVFSLNSSSAPAGQANRCQFWPRRGDLRARGAPKSQTLIVSSYDPETILVPSGDNATDLIEPLWALVFSLKSSSLPARQASSRQFWPRRGDFEDSGAPESQTLIVLSCDPDTILVPSGENAIDEIPLLWAFVFLLSSPSAPVPDKSADVSFGQGGAI